MACLAVGALGVLAPAAVAARTTVTCGSTITAPGSYALAADCSGAGITITASNVRLSLKGHTMTGPGTLASNGVDVAGGSAVAISGPGKITNYFEGVFLDVGTSDATVSGLTLVKNVSPPGKFGSGIAAFDTTDSTISGNTAINNGSEGIALAIGSTGNTVTRNSLNRNKFAGVVLVFATDNTIANNTANHNSQSGIIASEDGAGNGATGNTIRANTLNHNVSGIDLAAADNNNNVEDNVANNNSSEGIILEEGATGNAIHANTAHHNSVDDLFDGNPSCDSNAWIGNRFKTANLTCIH